MDYTLSELLPKWSQITKRTIPDGVYAYVHAMSTTPDTTIQNNVITIPAIDKINQQII